jgi:hypothetical protein
MTMALLAIGIIGLAMLVMAVGVIFKNRSLRGSCGGAGVRGPGGEMLTCDTCPRRDEAECSEAVGPSNRMSASHCDHENAPAQPELTIHR